MMRGGEEINRFRASRGDPIGLCRAETFGNSFEDSVSFRFPSRQSLDGNPHPFGKVALISSPPHASVLIPSGRRLLALFRCCD